MTHPRGDSSRELPTDPAFVMLLSRLVYGMTIGWVPPMTYSRQPYEEMPMPDAEGKSQGDGEYGTIVEVTPG
jgi:hypothetical protein